MFLGVLFVSILLPSGVLCDASKSDCAACRAIVTEAEWLIRQVDPKKRIQVGNFRVDPKGNQNIKDKKYARSEAHIEDIIESVCDKMKHYAEITFDDGTTQMVRTIGFDGRRLETKGWKLDMEKGNSFKYKCENFLEDREEKIISLLQIEEVPDIEELACFARLGVCSLDELVRSSFTLSEAQYQEETTNEADVDVDDEKNEEEDTTEKDNVDGDNSQPSEDDDAKTEL